MATDIRGISLDQLISIFEEKGEKAFRAKQVYEWLWKKSCVDFDQMTNLSLPLREWLKEEFEIPTLSLDTNQQSSDKTVKYGVKLHDSHLVEGVLIPTNTRMTACISSQVGCSLTCKFCATGYMDRKRNLNASEIYDQVVAINNEALERFDKPLSNIVYMGMGEPLLNYANVLKSVEMLTSKQGLDMSPRRITVSTAGIGKMIRKLGDDQVKFNLALSLHAANDEKRSEIMPINDANSLEELEQALNYYYSKTKNQITFEYIIFAGFNDEIEDARELWAFCKKVPSKVNIIEYNPISESEFKNTDPEKTDRFSAFLESKGVTVNVRRSRGRDIDAACGQLAIKKKAE